MSKDRNDVASRLSEGVTTPQFTPFRPDAIEAPVAHPNDANDAMTVKKCLTAHYDLSRERYFAALHGHWAAYNETQFRRVLKDEGFRSKPIEGEAMTPVEHALLRVQEKHAVDFAGPLAGYGSGIREQNGKRIQITDAVQLVEPIAGEWPIMRSFLHGLVGKDDQLYVFMGWVKIAVQSLMTEQRHPGQALCLGGPVDCGKSLLQALTSVFDT